VRTGRERHRPVRWLGGGAIALICALALAAPAAQGAAPTLGAAWSSQVSSSTARLSAEVNPNGLFTVYHFDYITRAAYEANLAAAKEGFSGASRVPLLSDAALGSGSSTVTATQSLTGLAPGTAYRYRIVAKNTDTATGSPHGLTTRALGAPTLADGRGWEMVSPVDKNGGQVAAPGEIAGGGVLQAAAQGSAVTYGSEASFAGGSGAPPASQYLAARTGSGWSTQNITAPIFSGTYDATDQGVPYRLFSGDLARGLLLNGDHCRGEGEECAVANPPLAGTDAPEGYQNYYLREGGGFAALLGAANAGFLTLDPAHFDLRLAGASPDLTHPVLSTCASLSASATEVPAGEGCDPAAQNLYEHSPGAGLSLVNLAPGESTGTPGASLAAQAGAVSAGGGRVYWTDTATGDLYLREGAQTKLVAAGAQFQTASADGSVAFYTEADEHLYRYSAAGAGASADLTPSGGVRGVLGASSSGDRVYYQDAGALKQWHSGATSTVAAGSEAALESDWPPATGTARVSADGAKLLFLSEEALTEYDNTDLNTKEPDSEVFLFDGGGARLRLLQPHRRAPGRPLLDPRLGPQRHRRRFHRLLQAPRALGQRQAGLLRLARRP
jgi:hypothetical protein